MKFSLKTLIWAAVLLALVLAGGIAFVPQPLDVETARVTEGPLRVSVQEDGKTRIREKYVVSAPVSGRLSRIELDPGDPCTEETLLAVILPSLPEILDARKRAETAARVQAAEATLQRAEANLARGKIIHQLNTSKYERLTELLPNRSVSQDEYDTAKADFLASEQAVRTGEFEVDIARFELDMAKAAANQFANVDDQGNQVVAKPFEIYSPIHGEVIRVFEESSKVVTAGTQLVELGDPLNLEMEIDVLSTDAVRIKPGAEVTVEHWGGESPLRGHVRVIEPGAFTKISSLGVEEQRVNIIADFDAPPEHLARLGDGYRIEARITVTELDQALLIPNSALFRHRREWHVLKVVDGKAVLQQVAIGLQNESHSQVTAGLALGDETIVYPSDDIRPGTSVKSTSLSGSTPQSKKP